MLELELTPEFEPRELSVPASIETVVIEGGPSIIAEPVKLALLQLASKVVYIDEHGQDYYDDLHDALYPLTSITAVYVQSGTVYTTDSLDSLKSDLTVTAVYDGGSTQTVPGSDYTLSGSLTAGTSTITVSYGGKTATFNVAVTAVPGVFSVANTLTGCTNSNSAATVTENTSYSGTITASSGYTLTGATVSITMGGTDITSAAYSSGVISIAAVTGDVAITVTAVAVTLSSISAVYTQSGTVYDTDSLDSLKTDLVVTATYSDSSSGTVPAADYTLSGTLTVGTSTITVSYGGKTDTFNVTVSAPVEELWINHLGNTGATANFTYAPFVLPTDTYSYNYSKAITAIEADFTAAGDISVGYCSVGHPSGTYDASTVTYTETLTVASSGVSKLSLATPLSIPTGYALVIGKNSVDTATFKYGGSLTGGFVYYNATRWQAQSKTLGMNIYRR